MKKILCLAVLALFSAGLACGLSITLTVPNAGERWTMDSVQHITWTYSDVGGNVRISLLNAGGRGVGTIANVPVTDGSYSWTVGQLTTGTAPAGEYLVALYVRSADLDERSDRTFFIVGGDSGRTASIRDVRLSGAPPYPIFNWVTVSWTATGVSQDRSIWSCSAATAAGSASSTAFARRLDLPCLDGGLFYPRHGRGGRIQDTRLDARRRVVGRIGGLHAGRAYGHPFPVHQCSEPIRLLAAREFSITSIGTYGVGCRPWSSSPCAARARRKRRRPVLRIVDGAGSRGE